MMGITKAELIRLLEDVPDHVEVRIATQLDFHPMQHHIKSGVGFADFENEVFYLADEGQVYEQPYLPEHVNFEGDE